MNIMAIDPSFNALATSILVEDTSTIYIDNASYSLGDKIGFEKVYTGCQDLWKQLLVKLNNFGVGESFQIDKIASEVPPPVSQFSAGLFALDTFILSNLWREYPSVSEIYVFSSSYLSTVHETRNYDKGDSTRLAKYFMNEVLQDDLKVVIPENITPTGRHMKGTLNNDRAESYLFLLRMIAKYDIKGLRNKIVGEMQGLGRDAERLLCSR
jgi:hypothetical protein